MPSPYLEPLVLTDEERATLDAGRDGRSAPRHCAALPDRSRACADGGSNTEVAEALGIDPRHGVEVAESLPRPASRRPPRRAPSWCAAHHQPTTTSRS